MRAKRSWLTAGVLIAVLVSGLIPLLGRIGAQGTGGRDFHGSIPAAPFPDGLDWLNVAGPLTWEDLRGKVVLLDFWTYGCINCIHIIPDLKRLEAEYAEELIVVGVHSAKFENEGETENIRQIIQRYEIEHPVVNDHDFVVWQTWGIRAWPTVLLVDPEGMVYGYHSGEGVYEIMKPIIDGMVAQFDEEGLIDREPIDLALETEARPESLLAFPGKVLADPAGGRLFIADTNHNRIVVADLETNEVLQVIGDADNGDGGFSVARFDKPQGMALSEDGQTLYVADTNNHTLRAIDLSNETVTTIAGTGRQAAYMAAGGLGTAAALSSPWDLVRVGDVLYVAMAGPHQLWSYDLTTQEVQVHSGSGREGIVDGTHGEAQLAQPSGITTDGQALYFADSEASGIRVADIDPAGGVRTLVGTGLFDFGDVDGTGDAVRLQHPLGVVFAEGMLYVADTYNSKIKQVNPVTGETISLAGASEGGYVDGSVAEARFDEPGGLSYADGRLYVADTNNHVIRIIDLAEGTVDSIRFLNPEALQAGRDRVVVAAPFYGDEAQLEPQQVQPGDGLVELLIAIPDGYKLNTIAESLVEWHPDGQVVQASEIGSPQVVTDTSMPVELEVILAEGVGELGVDLTLYYCEAIDESLCFVERARLHLPVEVGAQADSSNLSLTYEVIPPVIE